MKLQARAGGGAARNRRWRHHGERGWNHEKIRDRGRDSGERQGRDEKMGG